MKRLKKYKTYTNIFGWIIAIGIISLLLYRFYQERDQITLVIQQTNKVYLTLSLTFLLIAQTIRSQLSHISAQSLGYDISRGKAYRYWFLSQIGKYIPGGVWQYATRASFYAREGMPYAVTAAVVIWEIASIVSIGLAVSIVHIFFQTPLPYSNLIIASTIGTIVLLVLTFSKRFWKLFVNLKIKRAKSMIDTLEKLGAARYTTFVKQSLNSLLSWVLIALGFYFLLVAIPDVSITLFESLPIFPIAWTIGFLVLFAPVGTGPRELALTFLLAPYLTSSQILITVLLSRVWWSLSDFIHMSVALLLQIRATKAR